MRPTLAPLLPVSFAQQQPSQFDLIKTSTAGGLRRVALFSSATLHTVNTRPTTATRKTLQVYYGHASRPAMSHDYDSLMPPQFFRCVSLDLSERSKAASRPQRRLGRSDSPDPHTRAFYGNLNERTRDYLAKGRVPIGEERPESGPVYDDVDYR